MHRRFFLLMLLAAGGCASPTGPSNRDSVRITGSSPAPGSLFVVPAQYPYNTVGGVVMPPGQGLSVNIAVRTNHDIPWAQLNVYLLTGGSTDQYCGQNLPDAPAWKFLTPGWKTTVTVSGFQVYRLPCDVTGFRAMLHMRNNGQLTPPTETETIAESSIATTLHLSG